MSAALRRFLARYWRHLMAALVLALLAHAATVWLLPRAIMSRVMTTLNQEVGAPNRAVFPPLPGPEARRIVMPSPDLLYALCVFDLSERPLRVSAQAQPAPHYWSIALYAANSDNFLVWNDSQAAGQAVDWLLVGPKAYQPMPALASTTRLISAPSTKGVLLMRVLVADYARDRAQVEAARRSLRCTPLVN